MGYFGDGGEVGQPHQRIRRRLDDDGARRGRACVGDTLRVARVEESERQTVVPQDLVEQSKRAAVRALATHDVVAGSKELHYRVQAGHAAGEGEAVPPPFEGRDVTLERLTGGVFAARVLVALVASHPLLDVGRRQ